MDDHGESYDRDSQTSEAKIQFKIRFRYAIISSRSPTLVGRSWNPEDTSPITPLTNIMHATQLTHFGSSGLLLRLHAPGLFMEKTAFENDDFAEVKMAFNRSIEELKKRPAPNKVARVIMQIRPLYLTPQQKLLWIQERGGVTVCRRSSHLPRGLWLPRSPPFWFISPTFGSDVFRLVLPLRKDDRYGGKDEVHGLLPLRTATPHEDCALRPLTCPIMLQAAAKIRGLT